MRSLIRSAAILAIMLITSQVSAQSTSYVHNNNGYADDVLYIKFPDGSAVNAADKKLVGDDELAGLVTAYGYWTPVHQVSPEKLRLLRQNAERNLHKKLPDFSMEFHFHVYDKNNLEKVRMLFEDYEGIEKVFRVPIPFNATAPDFQAAEIFIGNASAGIDAETVWSAYSNRGAGIKVCDIEYGFNADHTDLPNVTIVGPEPQDPFAGDGISHGTAVLGEIASLNNGIGTTGIATDCELYFAGAFTDSTYNLEAAITNAIAVLSAGDVILLEQQIVGPNYNNVGQFGLVAVEWYEPYYNAIVLAIGQDITVVEAAGNGEQDFDDAIYSVDNGGHYPFLPGNESGAIIVGAGAVSDSVGGSDVARSRLWYSNHGNTVDLQGNGENVLTTGYGDLWSADGINNYFTGFFSGTSSASPIVTGAVVLLQSTYKNATGSILSPQQVRNYLEATGKPQQAGDYSLAYHIGPLPNVYKATQLALASVGLDENTTDEAMLVFPNPSPGIFMVRCTMDPTEMPLIRVTDLMGKEIDLSVQPLSGGSFQVSLFSAQPGIYFVDMLQANKRSVHKILIAE